MVLMEADRKAADRVVVAFDAYAARDALEAAAQLAAALDAQLTALFLENADIVRAAQLPLARETGAASGTMRPFAPADMRLALQTHELQAREAVAAAARGSGVGWHVEVVQAQGLAALCAAAHVLDLLVVGKGRLRPQQIGGTTEPHAVGVVLEDAASAGRARLAARLLAAEWSAPLLVLLAHAEALERRASRDRAQAELGGARLRWHALAMPDAGIEALVDVARRQQLRALVCADGVLRRNPARLEELITRVACPVVIAD
jgi:hypothetical protein